MWYEKNYRRHLCDMHIHDWNPAFLSEFSPEDYVGNLKIAGITEAMIYFQSHAGYCCYPTKTGKIHQAFVKKPDQMRRLVDLCHKNGIAAVGDYSLNYDLYELEF